MNIINESLSEKTKKNIEFDIFTLKEKISNDIIEYFEVNSPNQNVYSKRYYLYRFYKGYNDMQEYNSLIKEGIKSLKEKEEKKSYLKNYKLSNYFSEFMTQEDYKNIYENILEEDDVKDKILLDMYHNFDENIEIELRKIFSEQEFKEIYNTDDNHLHYNGINHEEQNKLATKAIKIIFNKEKIDYLMEIVKILYKKYYNN